ncbi:MAG: murein L,D-transpeptidase family protein [Rhizobiaceae bacterium]
MRKADLAHLIKAGMVAGALALGGCSADSTFRDINPKAEKQLSPEMVKTMQAKGMERSSPIMARIFKEEGKVEIWKQKKNGRYDVIASYDICKWSGKLGPKYIEGDRQAPEGFYTVRPAQMNPRSSYHLAFNIGYPNAFDRANGRTGSNLMVHGSCSSSGCYSMTDEQIEQIYAFGRDAFRGGQTEFQIQAFPFRMTAQNMARYKDDPNYRFWTMLKEGYDHFEITKVPPKVDVCEKRYVFNRMAPEGTSFNATGACPATTQPDTLASAYSSYQSSYQAAFTTAAGGALPAAKPSIAGLKEANIVSDWTKRRARGERISIEPPSLNQDGSVTVPSQMGRIDSPEGRRQAALDAAAAEKAKAEAEKKRAAAELAAAREAEKIARAQAAAAAANPPPPEAVAAAPAEPEKPGVIGSVRKRFAGLFGGG